MGKQARDCIITKTARLFGYQGERGVIEYLWKKQNEGDNFRYPSIAESTCSQSCVDLYSPLSPPDTPIERGSVQLTSYFGNARTSTETLTAHEGVPYLDHPGAHHDDLLPVELPDTSVRRVSRINTNVQNLNTALYELSPTPVSQKVTHSRCLPGATILDGNSNEHITPSSDTELERENTGSIDPSEESRPPSIELLPNLAYQQLAYQQPRLRRPVIMAPSPAPSVVANLTTGVRGHGLRKVRALGEMRMAADLHGPTEPGTLHDILSPLSEFEQRRKTSVSCIRDQRLAVEKPQRNLASRCSSITSHKTAPLAGPFVGDVRSPLSEQRGRRKRAGLTTRATERVGVTPQKSLAARCSSMSPHLPSKVYDNREESSSTSIPVTTVMNPTYDYQWPSSEERRQIGGPIGSGREESRWEEVTEPEDLKLCLAVMRKELERKRKEIRETLPGSP